MIVFVDDEPQYIGLFVDELERRNLDVLLLDSADTFCDLLSRHERDNWQLVVLDGLMPPGRSLAKHATSSASSGFLLYEHTRSVLLQTPIWILTNLSAMDWESALESDSNLAFYGKSDVFYDEFADDVEALVRPNT